MRAFTLNINGRGHEVEVDPEMPLLWALRDTLGLVGTKFGCGGGFCGACTVHVGGTAMRSCTLPVGKVGDRPIVTIEGLAAENRLHPVSQAFVDNDAQQCGYCTPGFVMAVKAFLDKNANPTREQVEKGLGGNLCRCGTYVGVRAAALQAAKDTRGGRNA